MQKYGLIQRIYFVAGLCLVACLGAILLASQEAAGILKIQNRTKYAQIAISRYSRLMNYMVDMETSVRGYMIGGDSSVLAPYDEAEEKFNDYARDTQKILEEFPDKLTDLKRIVELKLSWVKTGAVPEMMVRHKLDASQANHAQLEAAFRASPGHPVMKEERATIATAIAKENALVEALALESQSAMKKIAWLVLLAVGTTITGFSCLVIATRQSIQKVAKISNGLVDVSAGVSQTSGTLLSLSDELNNNCAVQNTVVSKTTHAVTEINASLANCAGKTQESVRLSTESERSAQEGQAAMVRMRSSLGGIQSSNEEMIAFVNQTRAEIEKIAATINAIGEKTKVVNEIVFQTKLLSFNASVEAARAGDLGRGFSIVAQEVEALARMSGKASVEISKLVGAGISQVQDLSQQASVRVDDLVVRTRGSFTVGDTVAAECEKVLSLSVRNANATTQLLGEISVSVKQQSSFVSKISESMHEIETLTGAHRGIAENATEFSGALGDQAQSLTDAMTKLTVVLSGNAGASAPALAGEETITPDDLPSRQSRAA